MSPRVVYFDLASGAGGDMLIAALVDAGRRIGTEVSDAVRSAVAGLGLGCEATFSDVERGGLYSLHCQVSTDGRSFSPTELREAIDRSEVADSVKAHAIAVIDAIVDAEAAVHGVAPPDVHLHELGSADTAADAIGFAVAMDALRIDSVAAADVPLPGGWTNSDHGRIPVPAPAAVEILRGASVVGIGSSKELVTPTAAAILVAHSCAFGRLPTMTLEGVGTGAGTAELDVPNICRAFVGEGRAPSSDAEPIVQLETNIDDQTPEALGYAIEALIRAGAVDAWVTPIVMKKSRPAFALSVLTHASEERIVLDVLFRETTTLGVRRRETHRWVAERDEIVVTAAGQCVRVKVASFHGSRVGATPEFDDCIRASHETGIPVKEIYAEASAAAARALDGLD